MILSFPCAAGNHGSCARVLEAHEPIAGKDGNQWVALGCDCKCHAPSSRENVLEVGLALDIPFNVLKDALAACLP